MKKVLGLLALAALLLTPSLALAQQTGIYIAPKFIYDYALIQGMQGINVYLGDTWATMNERDHIFGGALAIGYDFQSGFQVPVRAELEFAAFSQASGNSSEDFGGGLIEYDHLQLGIQTLFTNVYCDFPNSTAFTPYIGLGLGLAFIKSEGNWEQPSLGFSGTYDAKRLTNFAWNIGAGVAYNFSDSFSMDLGYRFAGLGKAETMFNSYDCRIEAKNIYMHQILFGIRVTF